MAAIVQVASGPVTVLSGGPQLPDPPTPGNTILLWKTFTQFGQPAIAVQTGFTEIVATFHQHPFGNFARGSLQARTVQIGDDETLTASSMSQHSGVLCYIVVEVEGELGGHVSANSLVGLPVIVCGGSISADDGDIVVGFASVGQEAHEPNVTGIAANGSAVELAEELVASYPNAWAAYIASDGGSESVQGTMSLSHSGYIWYSGVSIIVEGESPPPAEPGEESPYEPQEPARALIEIYVPDPGAYRWGEALWGESVWSTARWTDVTPQHVVADLTWGASRADAGILATPEAGLYTFLTWDPDRILDPANESSPYAPAIGYGLPIRVTHRGVPIRTGYVESVAYDYESKTGEIRATDNIAALAGVTMSPDTEIASTLFARARDVIAAVGLPISVAATPATGDPDVADWLEEGEHTAWHIIYQTALEALHIPWIDNHGMLQFRAWVNPPDRQSVVTSAELIRLVAFTSADSLYSIVQAMDAATEEIVERRITPLPRYGARTHKRTIRTLNAGDWADVVLEDRGLSGLRWRPGDIFPLDADSVEYFATRKIGEVLTIDYPEAVPAIEVRGRILGARVRIVDLGGQAGPDWRFTFAAATAALQPLIADGVFPEEFLTDDDDTTLLLFPDGVVGLEG